MVEDDSLALKSSSLLRRNYNKEEELKDLFIPNKSRFRLNESVCVYEWDGTYL